MKELSREEIEQLLDREINKKTIVDAALRNAEEKLKKLQLMMENLDSPDFGNCARCGQKIPTGRLILKPESPYCVRCAS